MGHAIRAQFVTDTLTTGELRQELEADLWRLHPRSTDPSLSVSLPPTTVSRLPQDIRCCCCWWKPIVMDDSQSARRLASSLSLVLKLLGCDQGRKTFIGVSACKGEPLWTEENQRWKNTTCNKLKKVPRFSRQEQHNVKDNITKRTDMHCGNLYYMSHHCTRCDNTSKQTH